MSLLEVKNLTVEFDSAAEAGKNFKAVDNVSLSIEKGEFIALVGESGSGKTVTSLSILDLLPESARKTCGTITFNGTTKSVIFQEPMTSLNPLIKIGKQIQESALIKGYSKEEAYKKAAELAALTGLTDIDRIFNSYPHQLSGGMLQRVMIASALMTDPQLLIADEPTTALDVSTQNEIIKIIYDLNKRFNMSLLLITHDFTIVKRMCSRIYIMYNGRIVESGTADQIFNNPKHPYTRALLNSIPTPQKRGKKLPVFFDEPSFHSTREVTHEN